MVMLFIFYIIVSSYLHYVLEIDGFSLNSKNEANIDATEINSRFNDSEIVTESGSVMSKHRSLYYIIQNPSDAPNLKSNIFDKMLSNEMLSIKQQLYEKNETNVSPIFITFKNSIATPTLELKQRWPIEKTIPKSENKHQKQNNNEESQVYTINYHSNLSKMDKNDHNDNNKFNDSIGSRILGVRSFSARPVHHLERLNEHECTKRQCSCTKTNPCTSCSFQCSRKKTCTQSEMLVGVHSQCTKNVVPLTYYPYYAYSTFFLGVTTDSSIIYYHPDVINELKYTKHKYSKIKTPVENLYFESDDDQYDDQNDEKEYLESENSSEEKQGKIKYPKHKYKEGKTQRPEKVQTVYFVDFKEENKMSETDQFNDGYLQILDKEKFVEDVVEDLKVYYSDAVIKECYCSLSSFKFRTENLIIYVPMLITVIM